MSSTKWPLCPKKIGQIVHLSPALPPTIWLPQPATGTPTNYAPVTLTMPQTGLSFTGRPVQTGAQLQFVLSPSHPSPTYRDVFSNGVTNYHESMTMYAQTLTAAIGTEAVAGAVSGDYDMQVYFGDGYTSHSPQFDYDIQHGPMPFYSDVLEALHF